MTESLRTAATAHDDLLTRRLDTLVPMLMERAGLDAWIVAAREYNEDPVLRTMLPATWLATARRRTILLFLRNGTEVERVAVARYAVGSAFPAQWDPETQPDQWGCVAELLAKANPGRIGINSSPVFPLADGLSASEHAALLAALPKPLRGRLTDATAAAIGWLEARLPDEITDLSQACVLSHGLLRRALSSEVITPDRTTTKDVEWWLRDAVQAAGFGSWFHPTVSVQRRGGAPRSGFATPPGDESIDRGALVHIDFGIVRHGLCTDQQQHAYVLLPGETAPPVSLQAGMTVANRLQDLLMGEFVTGRTGNQVLAATRNAAAAAGIDGLIYTHAIGMHGHAAGPTIGLWDQQGGVPGPGDYPLWPNTAHSIELQARVPIPEWDGQVVQFMLEEDAWFDGTTCRFLDGRQTDLWVVE